MIFSVETRRHVIIVRRRVSAGLLLIFRRYFITNKDVRALQRFTKSNFKRRDLWVFRIVSAICSS